MSLYAVPDLPRRPRVLPADAHKSTAGRVLVLAGSREMPGAALLVATSALRAGAGLVTLCCLDGGLLAAAPVAAPELILWDLSAEAAPSQVSSGLASRALDAVVVGPGLGVGPRSKALLDAVLDGWRGPLVLDADALNLVAEDAELRARVRAHSGSVVITPHPGEAQRLLGHGVGRSADERLSAARELVGMLGVVACLKGAGTWIVDPRGEREWMNPSGNPGMATAGSGDVLAGVMAALLVGAEDDAAAWEAARAAVYLHGLAGDRGVQRHGRRGLVASDIALELGPAEEAGPWG